MVDHDLLHRELASLAAVSPAHFDLEEGLHRLSLTASAALGLGGAGVTLHMPSGDTEYIAATDEVTMGVERLQDSLQEGACVDAITSNEVVAVNDLASVGGRWPEYAPGVLEAGFHAVAGVPVPFDGRNIGAINLYSSETRAWTTEDFTAGRLLAQLAAGYLINTHLLGKSSTLAEQLQHALDSRVVIEQAKGVLAGRHGMTPDAAFEVLRSFARGNRLKLHGVAKDVIAGKTDVLGGTQTSAVDGGAAAAS